MARIFIGQSPEGILKNRIFRVNSVIARIEQSLAVANVRERAGEIGSARIIRKRAHDEARTAMKLMGILMIEYNLDMGAQVQKMKALLPLMRKNGHQAPEL